MLNFKSLLFCVPAAILLSACVDDATEANEIDQKNSMVLEKGETLDSLASTEENVSDKGDKGDDGDEDDAGDDESADTTTHYKATCGTEAFDPSTHYCSQGVVQKYGYINDSRDGQTYKTVKIGKQTWMAENLNYDPNYLPKGAKDSVILSWCYGNKAENCEKYGRLYTWAAAMDSVAAFSDDGKGCGNLAECEPDGDIRGICPEGWHLPSYQEFETLINVADPDFGTGSGDRYSTTAGKFLKSAQGWNDNEGSSGNGNDAYGFSALSAGHGDFFEIWANAGISTYFWSSSESGIYQAICMELYYNYEFATLSQYSKYTAYSVRCLKD